MKSDQLLEVPAADIPLLLADLKSDFPNSVHVYYFIEAILKWKATFKEAVVKILALNGDFRSKFIVFYNTPQDLSDVHGTMHKWSHRDDDEEIIAQALRQTDQFPWAGSRILLTAMTPETDKVVLPVVRDLWKGSNLEIQGGQHVYWVPKEEAINWTQKAPPGTYISFLNETHAKEVNDVWPHRYDGSQELIASMIRVNFGVGLFDSTTHELMAWALHWFYGAVGALQTKEKYKKKGYGAAVLRAATREVALRGDDVHLNVLPENFASISLVEKVNYRLAYYSTWVMKVDGGLGN